MKLKNILVFVLYITCAFAKEPTTIVEVFSFSCSHCYHSENMVKQIISDNSIKYVPVLIVQNNDQLNLSKIYIACMLAGVGWKFRDTYFNAVFNEGYPENSLDTLKYVLNKIGVDIDKIVIQARSKIVLDKLKFDMQLINKYHISSTPTFIINGKLVVEGENSLQQFFQRQTE